MSRRKAARDALRQGYDNIVATGGDGTVSAVADEIQQSGAFLGIVPTGTANLIARSLDIPLDVQAAIQLIADSPRTRHIDGMYVCETGRTHFSHISMGVYSKIAKLESNEQKKRFGRGVYLWNMSRRLWQNNEKWNFKIDVDGQHFDQRASLVIVANGASTGVANMQWGNEIEMDDRRLDLCIVSGVSLADYARLAWHSLRGCPEADPSIRYVGIQKGVRITTEDDLPVRADGKHVADRQVSVEIRKSTIPVIVPEQPS